MKLIMVHVSDDEPIITFYVWVFGFFITFCNNVDAACVCSSPCTDISIKLHPTQPGPVLMPRRETSSAVTKYEAEIH